MVWLQPARFIIQTLHNVWLLLMRPLLPHSAGIWSKTASTLGVGASQADYDAFPRLRPLYRAIFLMKLPYVAADLGCAWTLTRLVSRHDASRWPRSGCSTHW